tara:strand:+ start:27 stop:1526 length:1500 start_codon:yes stop_codon:yes gene_type:complete
MSDKTIIDKAESVNPTLAVNTVPTESGQPHIVDGHNFIRTQKKKDLQYPRFFCVAKEMYTNNAPIHNAIDMTNVLQLSALDKGMVKSKGSAKSKEAADLVNYAIRNMSQGTWREAMNSACTDIIHGFSLLNMVFERRTYGKYKDKIVIKKLSPRTQSSVYGWVWDKNNRELKGVIQKPMIVSQRNATLGDYAAGNISLSNITNGFYKDSKYVYLKKESLLHFRFNPVDSNPQGQSPLIPCYDSFAEMTLVQQLELIGVQKDMSGVAVVKLPPELITKGSNPENVEDHRNYNILLQGIQDASVGKKSTIILSSEVEPQSKAPHYDVQFKGIDGGGKQYSTSDIIDQRTKHIYNIYGAQFIILGQDGHGSNAQSSNQMTIHDYYIQRATDWKVDVIDNQLIPKLLAMNGIELDYEDMPYFETADPSKPDVESLGKLGSRLASAGIATLEGTKWIYTNIGLPTEGLEDIDFLNLGGSGGEGSGNRSSQKEGGGSDTNNENAA